MYNYSLAGVNPQSIRGSATGVYVGPSSPEAHEAWLRDPDTLSGYAMTGCTGNMASNRVSFFFDLKGWMFIGLSKNISSVDSHFSKSFIFTSVYDNV